MIYTSELRIKLLNAFMLESAAAGWSPAYTLEHVRAIVCTELGIELPTFTEEDAEWAGQDLHALEHVPDVHDVGIPLDDAVRVAFQLDYFGIR